MKPKRDESVRKVALLGGSATSKYLAPFDDDDWEVWGMGPGWHDEGRIIKDGYPPMRWHRWFEIHDMAKNDPRLGSVDTPGYWEWIQAAIQDRPFYFRPPIYNGLTGIDLPFDELVDKHGSYFMDSTAAFMFAFLLEEKFFPNLEEVGMYGIDFAQEAERRLQKKGTYHFLQLCKLRGLKVHIPPESEMAYEPLPYPDSAVDPFLLNCKAQEGLASEKKLAGERHLKALREHVEAAEADLQKLNGVIETINYFKDNRE